MTGHIWSANCGWISLSNTVAYVLTDTIAPGLDSDGNGLPDAWERINFGHIGVDPYADPDGDGMSNKQEYLADTDPNNSLDHLTITAKTFGAGGSTATITWSSKLTRYYYIQKALGLTPPSWFDSGLGLIPPGGASTTRSFGDTNAPTRFYRVRAIRPLAP
jgi:hypothetical protein